jgi:hypothetical protein
MASKIKPSEIDRADDAHFASVGKVVSAWAILEVLMDGLIWKLADVSTLNGACITAQIPNSARRLDAIISLIHLHNGSKDLVRRFNKFSEKVRELQLKRNRVIHDPWVFDSTGSPMRFEISASKSLELGFKGVTTAETNKLAEEIKIVTTEFHDLALLTMTELKPSLKEHFADFLTTRYEEQYKVIEIKESD